MKTKKIKYLLVFMLFGSQIHAQPQTDVYLLDLTKDGLKNPVNISNNPGYDNQPSFWEDSGSVLYARTVKGQTEIARYHIQSGKTDIITNTLQGSEYSPTQIPGTAAISSIRLDTTGLQLLYRYELDGKSEVLVPELKIGYHAWINSTAMAAFVLGDPMTLQLLDLENEKSKMIEEGIGRSIHKFPAGEGFTFVSKKQEPWRITLYELGKNFKDGLIDLPAGVEDYCWSPDSKRIYTSQETRIVFTDEGKPWATLTDLSTFGIKGKISRMAVSPDGKWMAVVVE